MDISSTTQPRSDQINFDDVAASSTVITVAEVKAGSAEQPVEIHSSEYPGRPYKPNKSMRRVLVAAWGPEASAYVGRRMELYGDPTVKWAGQAVGGIRVSALSDIDKPLKVMLSESKGKRVPVTVQPLPDEPQQHPEPTEAEVAECTDTDALREMWQRSGDERRAQIMARKAELEQVDTTTGEVTDEEPPAGEPS